MTCTETEFCHHCETENEYKDVPEDVYVVQCKHCGKQLLLCDKCAHVGDNPTLFCDWHETITGGKCWRGETTDKAIQLSTENGIVVTKKQLSQVVAEMLLKETPVSLSFAIDFDSSLKEYNSSDWHGIKTIKPFDDSSEMPLLAIGFWGGGTTQTSVIILEENALEQVSRLINRYWDYNDLQIGGECLPVALFLEKEER